MADFSRQSDILPPGAIRYPVTIIGAGGIGSWTALTLAKCGYDRLTVWDPDDVDVPNCPNQVYRPIDIGRPKVEALREILQAFSPTGATIIARKATFTGNDNLRGITIVGVDSMAARTSVWERAKHNPSVPLFIDGRMAGESGRVYTINPTNPDEVAFYETTLYSDAEADPVPCGAKAIVHNLLAVAAFIEANLTRFWRNEPFASEILFSLSATQFIFRNHHGDVVAST